MATRRAEIHIARPPAAVWAVVGDFAGLGSWMPGVDSCHAEGDTRVVGTFGIEVRERLVARDDDTRTLRYSISEGPLPLDAHESEITVRAAADGASEVTWEVSVEPDEHVEMFADIYRQSLEALRAHCEARHS